MNFEPITYDYTLNEDAAPIAHTPTPPMLSAAAIKRKRMMAKRRQALLKIENSEGKVTKPKETKLLFDNEDIGLDLSLEETKNLLKRQMRGGIDGKQKLVPEEFRIIQQSPFYRADQSERKQERFLYRSK